YTPAADFTGSDSFTYTWTDADSNEASATVTVTVSAAPDLVNTAQLLSADQPPQARVQTSLPPPELTFLSLDPLNSPINILDTISELTPIVFGDSITNSLVDHVGNLDLEGIKSYSLRFSMQSAAVDTTIGIEEIARFPLRLAAGDSPLANGTDQTDDLIIQSVLYNRSLILEVDFEINSDDSKTLESIKVNSVNDQPLPTWLSQDPNLYLLVGEPPIGVESVELRFEITLSDGSVVVRYCQINVASGEISEYTLDQLSLLQHPTFANQLASTAAMFDESQQQLLTALRQSF
ncbi:MAG: hypothetical protein JKY89_04235, partial [Immundisolibacteraceae bacterium]|nr:hypothetical protein [Immundisolibacteraceae bacterium]